MGNINDFELIANPDDPSDYINNDGLVSCYDVEKDNYAIASNDEEIFSSCSSYSTVIMSCGEEARFLLNGDISPTDAYKLLYSCGFIDNCNLYVLSPSGNFDYDEFLNIIKLSSNNSNVSLIEPTLEDVEQNITLSKDSIELADVDGNIITYDIGNTLNNDKSK